MTKINAQPRPVGATVLSLLAIALAALVLPASSLAAPPPEGSDPVLTVSPQPLVVPTTTVGNQSPMVAFELHNESSEAAAIDKLMLAGADAGEFSLGASNCGTLLLLPGDHCSVAIALKPSLVGEKKAALQVTFAGGRPEQSFEVSGVSAPPHFSFHPGDHDFGLRPIRSEAGYWTFQLENDGQAPAQVGQLGFNGGNANGYWFNNNDCGSRWLQPGETCAIEIGFGPNEVGTFATQLQVSSGGENFSANLSGEGGQPIVTASPNPADFGPATVGSTSAIQTIVIANSGNIPAGFFIGIVAGGDSGSFQLLDENCTNTPLMPGGSCAAHVRFRPQGPGAKAAYLAFFGDSEGGAMVALQGEGVAPAVTLLPSSYHFGTQATGSKGPGHVFAVRNDGGAPLDLDNVAIAGADLDQFALAGDECSGATLAPGAECLVRVRFAPDSAGAKAAKLRVGSDAGTFVATLAGSGAGDAVVGLPLAGKGTGAAGSADQPASPRPARKGRHRRFVRGETLTAAKVQRPRRVHSRGGTVRR